MYSTFKINVLCSEPILFCPSLSLIVIHTLAHWLLSPHQGKYPLSVRKMEWNRWHQNDWNHLQWFPQLPYRPTPLSLICWLLLSLHQPPPLLVPVFLPNYTHRLDASPEPFQCHPGSQVLPKRLRLTGSPMALHKVSQEEKDRREECEEEKKGGGKRRQRFWCFSPPDWNLALILAALFLAHHTFCWKYQAICTKIFWIIASYTKYTNICAWSLAPQAAIFFFPNCLPSPPFFLLTPIIPTPPYLVTPSQRQAQMLSTSHVNEIVSRSKGMARYF